MLYSILLTAWHCHNLCLRGQAAQQKRRQVWLIPSCAPVTQGAGAECLGHSHCQVGLWFPLCALPFTRAPDLCKVSFGDCNLK